jgi:hypothetical protein
MPQTIDPNYTPLKGASQRGLRDLAITAVAAVGAYLVTGGNLGDTLDALGRGEWKEALRPLVIIAASACIHFFMKLNSEQAAAKK